MRKIIYLIFLLFLANNIAFSDDEYKKWEYKVVRFESTTLELVDNKLNEEIIHSELERISKELEQKKDPEEVIGRKSKTSTILVNEDVLNKLGKEGWEIATSFLEMETVYPNFGKPEYVTGIQPNIRPKTLVIILKRPIMPNKINKKNEFKK